MPFCFLIQNFAEIGQLVDDLWPKNQFSRWRPPPSWNLKISIFGHVTVMGLNICCSVPNFIKIARFFTEIWWFSDLQNGGRPPSRPPSWICYDVTILHRRAYFRCPNIVLKFHVNRCCSFRDTCNIVSWPFGMAILGFAHALYHVTLIPGVQNNHSYEIFDPYLPIHYATFMHLRWRLRGVLRGAIVKRFLGENFQSHQKWSPKWR